MGKKRATRLASKSSIKGGRLTEEMRPLGAVVNALIEAQNISGAEQVCVRWLGQCAPHDVWIGHFNMGVVYEKTKRWPEAVDAYNKAIALAPDQHSPQINLAVVFDNLGLAEEAVIANEKAIQCMEKQADQNRESLFLALNIQAVRLARRGRLLDAEASLLRSIDLMPTQVFALSLLSQLRGKRLASTPSSPAPNQPPVVAKIHQIYYDEKTRLSNDPLFIPLDNSHNTRPDWREFWPIRNFLKKETFDEHVYYGFLSPRFCEKTTLTATAVFDFISAYGGACDVIGFSPYYDQIALFNGGFDQGDYHHPGLHKAACQFFDAIGEPLGSLTCIGTPENTIFCNYFVAKPRFWMQWLELCEKLFDICEHTHTELAQTLNAPTTYTVAGVSVPLKVFLMERMVGYLLATGKYSGVPYPPLRLGFSSLLVPYAEKIIQLETEKIVAARTGNRLMLDRYIAKRDIFLRVVRGESTVADHAFLSS